MSDARADATSPPVVLFLHGLGCTGDFWADVLSQLSAAVRPIVVDLPGFGSSAPLREPMTVPALARAVRARLDAADVASAVVVGHSLGGMVAQELVSLEPRLVDALVLCNTIPGSSPRVREINSALASTVESSGSAALAEALLPAMVGPEPLEGTEAAVARFRQQFGATSTESLASALRGIAEFDMRDRLPHVAQPVLVVGGEFEGNLDAQQELADLLPRATMNVLAGTSHLAPAEAPTAFTTVLTNFLGTLEPRRPARDVGSRLS